MRRPLTNQRLVRITDEEVTFTWKDYADAETQRQMTLSGEEFLRRFLLPSPPAPKLEAESWQARLQRLTGIDPLLCTTCGQPAMRCIEPLAPVRGRAPPAL